MDEFRLLGPLEVVADGKQVDLGAAKPRALLALLLLNRNRVVSTDRLIDELWGDEPPARATKTLQVYVSQLRKALGPERLLTRPPGYELRIADGELDLDRFEQLAAEGRYREALALWRGPPDAAAAWLEDRRLAVLEDALHAELAAGEISRVIPELEQLVAEEPLRERPRELLMVALYRAGRQADALELFRKTRELYVEELGIEPGESLRELERAILRQDPDLRAPPRSSVAPPTPVRRRRAGALVAALLAVAAIAAIVIVVAATHGGGTTNTNDNDLRSFVVKVENFLSQSRDGRIEIKRAIAGALDCSLSPQVAAAELDHVQRNRQSLLEQLAALHVPAGTSALRASDLLQRASHASIAADWIYRDWLRAQTSCPRGGRGRPPAAARAADARATALKQRFVTVFAPLARQFGRRVWRASEF